METIGDAIDKKLSKSLFHFKGLVDPEKLPDGSYALNKQGRQLINQFYKPPKQHGKKHVEQWQK